MKIAITSDLHLTSKSRDEARFITFETFLKRVKALGITQIVIAGDCFDARQSNYSEWDRLFGKPEYRDMIVHMIPGNHDALIQPAYFTHENLRLYPEPFWLELPESNLPVLLIPYQAGITMGEILAGQKDRMQPSRWILIGHGDWSDGLKTVNASEPGVYMPLTRSDIETYRPARAILGHVHKPADADPVHVIGSPCPLDINETGRRRFLVLDTETAAVESLPLASERIYFQETIMVFPGGDEWARAAAQIQETISSWRIQDSEREKVRIRIRFSGFTSDKSKLMEIASAHFRNFQFYQDEAIAFDDVFVSMDEERSELVSRTVRELDLMNYHQAGYEPDAGQILIKALKTIYEVDS